MTVLGLHATREAAEQQCAQLGPGWHVRQRDGASWLVESAPEPEVATPDPFEPRELRHTFASWLHAADVREAVRAGMLGHVLPGVTMGVYTHLMPGDLDKALRLLNTYLADAAKEATG